MKAVMMLRTNRQSLVEKAVAGKVSQPRMALKNPWLIDPAGTPHVMPGTGGITYNVAVGDSALDFTGDHIEPCVSVIGIEDDRDRSGLGALSILSCVGNEARIVSGQAADAKGVVTGKHGGVEHVLVDFPPAVLDKLSVGDAVQIRAVGQGLAIKDYPDVHVMNLDPGLFGKLDISTQGGQMVVPVTHVVPSSIMGSGIGSRHSYSGDYDMQLADREMVRKFGLQNLRIGDLIAITDADCRYGRSIRSGALTIGIVVHGSCLTSGHGPGVTVLMTTARKLIVPKIDDGANLGLHLGIGRGKRPAGRSRGRRRTPRSHGG
jgi:hypothetical protein